MVINYSLWALLAGMTLLALFIVIIPLWRRKHSQGLSRKAANVQIYRERISELEAEHALGRIDAVQMQRQVDDLGRHLLYDVENVQGPVGGAESKPQKKPWWISAALILAVPAVAFGLYWSAGTWRTPTNAPDLPFLAERLEQRLNDYPEDAEAWALLGRARRAMNDVAAAEKAFNRANALMEPPKIEYLVEEAEAATLAANGDLTGHPANLLKQVLEREPKHIEALWLAGLAARQAGDTQSARQLWGRLLLTDIPPEFTETVKNQLSKLPPQ